MVSPARIEIPTFRPRPQAAPHAATAVLPELILFEHENFNINYAGEEVGDCWRTTFNFRYVGDEWRDGISSIIVLSGVWEFFERADYESEFRPYIRIGPGHYPNLESIGIPNEGIKSFRVVVD